MTNLKLSRAAARARRRYILTGSFGTGTEPIHYAVVGSAGGSVGDDFHEAYVEAYAANQAGKIAAVWEVLPDGRPLIPAQEPEQT